MSDHGKLTLPEPSFCRKCGTGSQVLRSVTEGGRRLRRRECLNPDCKDDLGRQTRWTTFESRMDPRRVVVRVAAGR